MWKSFEEIKQGLFSGTLTCVHLVQHYLERIEHQKHLNAFVEVYAEEALEQAKRIDEKIKQGTAGKLAGMVVGIKDVLCYQDHKLSAGSKILQGFESQFTATAVQRLLDADAIIIGRQNCDEFAMGSSNENSCYGPVLNAADTTRVPGGSSGGSAVAVQAGMCLVSLGSDTGGSVRQPASFTGTVGLKPTYARISRWGLIAYASSFDCIGIFANNVGDVSIVLETIAGKDSKDSTSSSKPVPQYSALLATEKKYKIGFLADGLESSGVQEDIRNVFSESIERLKAKGHTLEKVELKLLPYAVPAYYILTTAEASSNLSRYDGVKYGYRSPNTTDLMSMYKKSRSEAFGKEVKRRIMLGTFVLSASYYDAYYTKAQKIRRLLKNEYNALFQQYDFLIMPVSPITPWKFGALSNDPLAMYLADIFTVSANIVGVPAISVPIGTDAAGMPVGLQIVANDFQENELLSFSYSNF